MLIGGMDEDQQTQNMVWISQAYMQDDMTWCVATARPQDLWRNIFQIYTPLAWSAIAVVIFMVAIIVYHLLRTENRCNNFVWAFMVSIATILGHSISYKPSKLSIRVVVICLFMYGMIIRTSFSALLISFLTQPILKYQIDDLYEAIEAGFKFAGGNNAFSHLGDPDDPVI